MINPFKDINWKPGPAEMRAFGRSLIIGFPVLATVFFLVMWWRRPTPPALLPFATVAGAGMAVGLLAMLLPRLARPAYYLWYGLAASIGLLISNVILTLVYYVLFTPIGLLRRWSGADPLRLRRQKAATTHWVDLPEPTTSASYFRQY